MFLEDDYLTEIEPEPTCVADRPREHILVIDDDATQTEVLSYRFSKHGYRVSVAHSATEGAAIARADHPDLILLDIRLPDGDGLEICADFCDSDETAGIPVIIVSAMDKSDIVRHARAAGCQYYVRKPYDPNALLILAQNAIYDSRDW